MQSTRERAQKMGALKNKYIKTKQKNKNGKNDEENFRSREEAERKKNGEKKNPKKFNENFKTTHAQNSFRFRFLSQILNG